MFLMNRPDYPVFWRFSWIKVFDVRPDYPLFWRSSWIKMDQITLYFDVSRESRSLMFALPCFLFRHWRSVNRAFASARAEGSSTAPIAEPPSVPPRSSRPLIAFWLNQGARIECQKGRPSGILSPPIRRPILQMMHSWLSQKNKWKGDNNVATSNWTKRTSSVCHIQNGLAMQMWDPRLLHVKLSDQNYARRMLTTPDKHSLHIKYLEG